MRTSAEIGAQDEQGADQRAQDMASTQSSLRPILAAAPQARRPSAKMPAIVGVSTVVVRSGTASLRAVAFCMLIAGASSTTRT